MEQDTDVLVAGACTAGLYFGGLMARQGYRVLICDPSSEDALGSRYDIIHIRQNNFNRFGIPEPKPGDEDYVTIFHQSILRSALDKWPKNHRSEVLVLRRAPLMKRLLAWAREQGAIFLPETELIAPVFDALGRLAGADLRQQGEILRVNARLTADATGIKAALRTQLPASYGVENFVTGPRDQFYVVLQYVQLKNPADAVACTRSWPFYKTWIAPQLNPGGAIFGVGANLSFEYADRCWKRFAAAVPPPEHTLSYTEKSSTPYRRPPYSFVGDGFVALGDAACITNPMSGEGVPYAWLLCSIAAEEFGRAMQGGAYPRKEAVWLVNSRYAKAQGAEFAQVLATLPGVVKCSAKENDYEFEQGLIFEDDDERVPGSMVTKLLKGLFTGKLSLGTIVDLIKAVDTGGKIGKHYRAFPEKYEDFDGWVKKAAALWEKAENIADLAEKDLVRMGHSA
ncbi:MAG: FAD-dependent monooxygenase [Treponema sp.]|jgi:flavin-dependent dehydrogenase|nr:FAD-dependent monooxygenase [Treponema sp.]